MFSLVTLLSACETPVLWKQGHCPAQRLPIQWWCWGKQEVNTCGAPEDEFEIGRLSFYTLQRVFKMELVLKGFPASLPHSVRETAPPPCVAFSYILDIKDLILSQCGGECTVCTQCVGLYPVLLYSWASG